jgi:dihydrodipicolinate reductase
MNAAEEQEREREREREREGGREGERSVHAVRLAGIARSHDRLNFK